MSQSKIQLRKHLHADALFTRTRLEFEKIPDHRTGDVKISLPDALMSGFAMFSLKDSSLLVFDKRRKDETKLENLQRIYQINEVPCDSQMREILDEVLPEELLSVYTTLFRQAQRGNVLEKLSFMEGCYLLSVDGTEYFFNRKFRMAQAPFHSPLTPVLHFRLQEANQQLLAILNALAEALITR